MKTTGLEVRTTTLPPTPGRTPAPTSAPPATILAVAQPTVSRVDAFDAWARSSGPGLLRFARLITGDSNDAADATQDALMAVYARWRRLSADDAQDGYARRVIVNRNISRWRRVGRREALVEIPDVTGFLPDHADAFSDTVAARVLLEHLTGRQRAAVMLRFYDDLSFAQIAEILSCRESTARSYIHRALTALRSQLDATTVRGADHD